MGLRLAPDRQLAALATRQHDYVTYSQMRALGLSRGQVEYRIRVGRLIRVFSDVYAVGYLPSAPLALASAAVLACGPGALLSHASAAALWGWRDSWPRVPEVTTIKDRRPSGIAAHCSTTLSRPDRTRQRGIAVTSPARTLRDSRRVSPRLS